MEGGGRSNSRGGEDRSEQQQARWCVISCFHFCLSFLGSVFCVLFFLFLLNWSEQQQGQCVISGDVEVISGGGGGEFT